MLEKYVGLSDQAENSNEYKAYKELIDIIRVASYEELHGWMRDAETILKVLVRGEAQCKSPGLGELVKDIVKLGNFYLLQINRFGGKKIKVRYTYEYCDEKEPTTIIVCDERR